MRESNHLRDIFSHRTRKLGYNSGRTTFYPCLDAHGEQRSVSGVQEVRPTIDTRVSDLLIRGSSSSITPRSSVHNFKMIRKMNRKKQFLHISNNFQFPADVCSHLRRAEVSAHTCSSIQLLSQTIANIKLKQKKRIFSRRKSNTSFYTGIFLGK